MKDKWKTAFDARLAYEKNCIAKYDYPDMRPSKPPRLGERMEDFAWKFNTTVEEMINVLPAVEKELKRQGIE